jgi:hypothetical protein
LFGTLDFFLTFATGLLPSAINLSGITDKGNRALLWLSLQFLGVMIAVFPRGGLIGGIHLADKNGKVSFGEAWAASVHYFLDLLMVYVEPFVGFLLGAVALGIIVIPFRVIGITPNSTLGSAFLVGALLSTFGFVATALVLIYLAQFAVVIDSMASLLALRRSWIVLKKHAGRIVGLAVSLFILLLPLSIPSLIILTPAFLAFSANPRDPSPLLEATKNPVWKYLAPVNYAVSTITETWTTAVWALAYKQLSSNLPTSNRSKRQ